MPWHEQAGALTAKLRAFKADGRYDTLFLGSSRIYRHIDPRIFDAATAELGAATRSFNCGVDGMFAPEDSFACERLLTGKSSVRWVFLEVSQFAWPRIAEPAQSMRVIAWHNWRRTLAACRAVWPAPARESRKGGAWQAIRAVWPQWRGHLRCFVRRSTNAGRGAMKARQLLAAPAPTPARETTDAGLAGFVPLVGPPGPSLAEYKRALAERAVTPARRVRVPEEAERNLHGMIELIRRHGSEPILLSTPMPVPLIALPQQTLGARLLDFNDIHAYPALFQVEHRHDFGHLNAAGAEAFSKLLARVWLSQEPKAER